MSITPTDPVEVAEAQWSGISGTVAYDVGAHLGENIPHLIEAGFTQILAFEPEHALYAQLESLWPQAECHRVAVSRVDGFVQFGAANGMLTSLPEFIPGDSFGGNYPCRTLDSIAIERGAPEAVIVDVEGHEDAVLDGAWWLAETAHPSWLIEFHTIWLYNEVWQRLTTWGYRQIQTIRHPHYAPDSPNWHGHGWIKALRS